MSELKMKLCGLTEADIRSLQSKINIANNQLNTKWTIVDSEPADLYIYSFETDEGIHRWQLHKPHTLTALLASEESFDDNFDFFIKKPLRAKNLAIVLRDIEQKIQTSQQREKSSNTKMTDSSSFLSSLFTGKWFGKKSGQSSEPVLRLHIPDYDTDNETTLLTTSELASFLQTLKNKGGIPQAEDIAAYLFSLNRTDLTYEKRFSLIESISTDIRQLVITHYPGKYKFRQDTHVNFVKLMHSLNQVLTEFILAYQIIVNDFYQQGKKIKSHKQYGIAINRIAEFSELLLVFNGHYYFSLPHHTLNLLHQLYHYCEYYDVLDEQFESSTSSLTSFNQIYKRILLTGITNPNRLPPSGIQRLSELMAKLAEHIKITTPESGHIPSTVGNFILDLESDSFPKPSNTLNESSKLSRQIRLFDTHALLEEIEQIFKHNKQSDDLKLLKMIAPHLNASYTRQFDRQTCHNKPKITLLLGLPAIHVSLTSHTESESFLCTVNNKSTGGMMVESPVLNYYSISIGDIVGIIDQEQTLLPAIIRWINSNQSGQTYIGLEFMALATPITLELENKSDFFIGLIVPVPINGKLKNTILVDKSTYLPLQAMTVTEGQKKYTIRVDKLIDSTLNCTQFIYTKD